MTFPFIGWCKFSDFNHSAWLKDHVFHCWLPKACIFRDNLYETDLNQHLTNTFKTLCMYAYIHNSCVYIYTVVCKYYITRKIWRPKFVWTRSTSTNIGLRENRLTLKKKVTSHQIHPPKHSRSHRHPTESLTPLTPNFWFIESRIEPWTLLSSTSWSALQKPHQQPDPQHKSSRHLAEVGQKWESQGENVIFSWICC